MTSCYLRDVVEEVASLEEETLVLVVAWSGTLADKQAEIALTCLRMHERLKAVRKTLEDRCGR